MKTPLLLVTLLLTAFLSSCSREAWRKAFATPVVQLSYDDLGTETMLIPVLGSRGSNTSIVVHNGATNASSDPRHLNVHQGLLMLRRNARSLPHTPENQPLRQRMTIAYDRMYNLYRTRRDASLAMPPFAGRGSTTMMRMGMMPPVPPTL